ncbi:MAG: PKD domain-containing protein [Chromatiales bacterium]|nr:PKD domain-containing protein [Chromatiales bacterium]
MVIADDDDERDFRTSAAESSSVQISSASWSNYRQRLTVSGRAGSRETVVLKYTGDGSVLASTRASRRGSWSVEVSEPSPVPCKVRAETAQSDDERDVDNAPSNCSNHNQPPANQSPTANANGPYTGTVGESISFDSEGSNDPDGEIVDYSWDFGDGASSNEDNPSHTYSAGGTYTVTLTVTDNDGATGSDSTTATVSGPPAQNQAPTANANGPYSGTTGVAVSFSSAGSADSDGTIASYSWDFGDGATSNQANPGHAYSAAGSYVVTLTVTDNDGASDSDSTSANITDTPPVADVSINSVSTNGVPGNPVMEQPFTNASGYKIFAINDLGMHCGDLDTRISSILPPFSVLHAQVLRQGGEPELLTENDGIQVTYSASSNPSDPILSGLTSTGLPVASSLNAATGEVYKTNFWDIALQAYDPFYPAGILPSFMPAGTEDLGLPMPDVEELYLGSGNLAADQQAMPGRSAPYVVNNATSFHQFVGDMPFFLNFPFGYVARNVEWFEAAGVPLTAFDDFGRENPWPLYRVQASAGGNVLASVDTVVPISGEANCGFCHNAPVDGGNGEATQNMAAGTVATVLDDPEEGNVPLLVSQEYAADLNIVRLHDQKHGTTLEAEAPVVCQRCHYTPALDLAQLGPLGEENDGPLVLNGVQISDSIANGRDQVKNKSMSNVMHSHHAATGLFPDMPPALNPDGTLRGGTENPAVKDTLDATCYQCHPGRRTDCLRGAMANGGMVCQDCHGQMEQVGNDFSRNVSAQPGQVGAFELASDFYTNPDTVRVPWANEPGCGSCHTGDASNNLHGTAGTVGALDGIRLLQAYKTSDPKATPIVPSNKRFAENTVAASDPGAGNPMLYRVSTGHGGVFCEACHGATHGIWPNKNPLANDNVTATQLQGHSGVIVECSTCHGTAMNSRNTLDGPHGMHPVGDNTSFARGGHENLAENNPAACATCHGPGSRRTNQGTVLSAAKADRNLRGTLVRAGDPVGCAVCHSGD